MAEGNTGGEREGTKGLGGRERAWEGRTDGGEREGEKNFDGGRIFFLLPPREREGGGREGGRGREREG